MGLLHSVVEEFKDILRIFDFIDSKFGDEEWAGELLKEVFSEKKSNLEFFALRT